MIDCLFKQNASCVCKTQPLAMTPCGRKKLCLAHHNCIFIDGEDTPSQKPSNNICTTKKKNYTFTITIVVCLGIFKVFKNHPWFREGNNPSHLCKSFFAKAILM